ncbi:MAG: protein translocase subunit SecF [Patescibacteria group bacterium]|nr:protein translocase subunit SecF [Patescibacteria group bacterium]MDD5715087.1 protein translocase subunit SecF [Patescibacteria group bacterium]
MYQIIQRRNLWFIISLCMIVPGIVAICMGGLRLGIDFTGGTLITVAFNGTRPSSQSIEATITSLDLGSSRAQPLGENEMSVRLKTIDNATYQNVISAFKEAYGSIEEKSFDTIGPTVGKELRNKAFLANGLVLLFIILYISFAFRKISTSRLKSWVFGVGAIIALIHDLLIVVGAFAIMGRFWGVEIDSLFITALLTVLGFSVHDTIVVYDRIREQLRSVGRQTFEEVVNRSINQTMIRSLNTSLTTIIVLLALFLFGGSTIQFFVLALIIGITVGTFSSIFIASPLLVIWDNFRNKEKSTI